MSENVNNEQSPDYLDTSLPIDMRVKDLVSRMTLHEKIWQMLHYAPAIPRLGIPEYNWWNECLHGVGRAGVATVFPQAIGLAATWNTDLIRKMAEVISDEARAKHHEYSKRGDRGIYKGLTFWSPNINIFRDPRWGRGQETYGEDPYLTSCIGVGFIKGLQGDDPNYLKLVATPKHYAVHSGPEADRHHFDAVVSKKDLRETYLPAFRDCIVDAKAFSIMGAYNRTNGEVCCGSKTLLQDILRDEWGFEGYIVSDCGAICDFHLNHKVTGSPQESAALAVNNACDLNCGDTYGSLIIAVEQGLISEAAIDVAVSRLFTARFRLGMFDPEEKVPYASIPYEINDCAAHRELALRTALESVVLLKNENRLLPLSKELKSIAVIGPNAVSLDVLIGNYFGTPSKYVTPLDGIMSKVEDGTRVYYARGCEVTGNSREEFAEAAAAASRADVVVMCMGLSPRVEGEEGDAANSDGGGDRLHLNMPGVQQELLEMISAIGKPVVLVLFNGSPVAVNWAQKHVPAILTAWYPGEEGGSAIADILFGDYSPAGRLPITFVKSLDQLPPFVDYSMKGRTYRYMDDEPLYPFGFGLSYTSFEYRDIALSSSTVNAGENLAISVHVENTGAHMGDEVVQLYLTDVEATVDVPIRQLVGFQRITLAPGQRRKVTFTLTPKLMSLINDEGERVLEPGKFAVTVGGNQGDCRSCELGGSPVLTAEFTMTGESVAIPY
ncbi:MAG: glycoside hydrolase family 3 C-terminal domain-containing protein [Armatimonadota bacterium]